MGIRNKKGGFISKEGIWTKILKIMFNKQTAAVEIKN